MTMNLTDMLVGDRDKPCTSCPLNNTMSAFPAETPVGMAYVPYQRWKNVYEPSAALDRGTVFEDLDKPFLGEKAI